MDRNTAVCGTIAIDAQYQEIVGGDPQWSAIINDVLICSQVFDCPPINIHIGGTVIVNFKPFAVCIRYRRGVFHDFCNHDGCSTTASCLLASCKRTVGPDGIPFGVP